MKTVLAKYGQVKATAAVHLLPVENPPNDFYDFG